MYMCIRKLSPFLKLLIHINSKKNNSSDHTRMVEIADTIKRGNKTWTNANSVQLHFLNSELAKNSTKIKQN